MKPFTTKIRLVHEHRQRTGQTLLVFAPRPLKAASLEGTVDGELPRFLDRLGWMA